MKCVLKINHDTINGTLPELPSAFEQDMLNMIARLPEKRMEQPMKRKVSFGLVLALVLALLVIIGAVAAIFGGKDFTREIIAPLAQESTDNKFTPEEMQTILAKLDEYGIALEPEYRQHLETFSEYKEELMRVIVKTELGFYPSTWSVEDQYWYNEMLVQTGLYPVQEHALPREGELTQEQAIQMAIDFFHTEYSNNEDFENKTLFLRHLQCLETYQVDNSEVGRCWVIEYEPLDVHHGYYHVAIAAQGQILYHYTRNGMDTAQTPDELITAYDRIYHQFSDWEMDTWVQFSKDLTTIVETYGLEFTTYTQMANQRYAIPDDKAITKEEAIAMVDTIECDRVESAVYLLGNAGPKWKITLQKGDQYYLFEMDAYTGQVINAEIRATFDTKLRRYVLNETQPLMVNKRTEALSSVAIGEPPQSAKKNEPLTELGTDGYPLLWRHPQVPQAFWDYLAQTGLTKDNAVQKSNEWIDTYGEYFIDWPIELAAVYDFWHYSVKDTTAVNGIPLEEHLSPEAAIGLILPVFKEHMQGVLTESEVDDLRVQIRLNYGIDGNIDYYYVQFFAMVEGGYRQVGDAGIDARTGVVQFTSAAIYSNG